MSQELIDQCARGDFEAVKKIVGNGADVNYRGAHGNSPLGYSAYAGHTVIMGLLLDAGALPNNPASEDSTPVALAAYEGNARAVQILLERGADPNLANPNTGVTPLHAAVVKGNDATRECVSLLISAGADPNASTMQDVEVDEFYENVRVYSECPIHWAAAYCDGATVGLLIEHGADVSRIDGRGETPLQWAGRHQRPHSIRELLHKA